MYDYAYKYTNNNLKKWTDKQGSLPHLVFPKKIPMLKYLIKHHIVIRNYLIASINLKRKLKQKFIIMIDQIFVMITLSPPPRDLV